MTHHPSCEDDAPCHPNCPVDEGTSDPARVQSVEPAQGERLRDTNSSSLVLSSSSLRTLREWAVKERDYWDERNADRFWQMSRVVHQIDAALLSPVAVDDTHEDTNTRTGDDGLSTSSRTASTNQKARDDHEAWAEGYDEARRMGEL
jgi:hypothetical protein